MLSPTTLQSFQDSVRGPLLTPIHPNYDEARKIHNALIDKRPALIVRCAGVSDVVACVRFARENSMPVSVRGAGHNVAGTSLCDDGLLIDLSAMKSISIDPAARRARVDPGVTWAELSHDLQTFGLAASGGFVGSTGVSGLTLGGGLGWMIRKHGLAIDNLLSAQVITAEGHVLTASERENADLFWGIRGGGGNFGIVTSFEFQVHPAGTVLCGMVMHPVSRAGEALRYWREFQAGAPEEMTLGALLFTAPADLPLPDAVRGKPVIGIGGVCLGPLEAAEQLLHPLRQFGPPAVDMFQPAPYSAAQTMADFLWPRGQFNYWKSSYMTELSDTAIDILLRYFGEVPSPRTVVVLENNGGAMSRVAEDATAFGDRRWPFNLLATSLWTEAREAEANTRWTRDLFDAMRPYLAGAAYVNYLGEAGDEQVRQAYGEKYQRLAALKDKYDPTNFFCRNQNIKPSRSETAAA